MVSDFAVMKRGCIADSDWERSWSISPKLAPPFILELACLERLHDRLQSLFIISSAWESLWPFDTGEFRVHLRT